MIHIDDSLTAADLQPQLERLFELSAGKIRQIDQRWNPADGTPVYTVDGQYTTRGWTEWTEGFVYGSAILQFDATGDEEFLEIGKKRTVERMATHVTHIGVHDHGFNNVSTYGNLLRLMKEERIPYDEWERHFYELALKSTGAVQGARWTDLPEGLGYVYSFNGPHSLFSDTIRSMRALVLADRLGHVLMAERDRRVNLLERAFIHAKTTAKFNVYYGEGRDYYDERGRVVHESVFNLNDGSYRCPSSQQGYSPFTTWTRGLSWILAGYPEQLEFIDTLDDAKLDPLGGRTAVEELYLKTAKAVADWYIENSPTDGMPYWDSGAPGLAQMGDYLDRPAEIYNDYEPVDSSTAVISAQGLLRLGHWLAKHGDAEGAKRYRQAGLTVAKNSFSEAYLSADPAHEGLLLHGVYHRPNGWDNIPEGQKVPCDESVMWGDYHARELAVMLLREAKGETPYTFFNHYTD